MTTTELRVFISSTFRDLQEEREHLVKKIFPEIRSLCRARGVTFTDIDLRWGITEEEAEREGIIHICLDEIDRCRPYFIGILGERYGWTPPHSDAARIADRFPVLGSRLLDGASITEMEIVHGVLANPAMAGHAFFYFRDHDATPAEFVDTDPEIARRLRDLKDRIRQSGFPVRENFTSAAELGAWLEEDLRRVIEIEHPESETPSPLELERRAHRAFAASRIRAYVAIPEYDKRFDEWITNEGRGVRDEGRGLRAEGRGLRDEELWTGFSPSSLIPHPSSLTPQPSSLTPHPSSLSPEPSALVILAASGLGKSSLVAHLVNEYRTEHPTAFIIEHYVGASQASGTATAIMRHVIDEIRERFGIPDEAATKPGELERSFPNWLYRGEHFANQLGIEMLIVIDAVNQLDDAGRRLAWLPLVIPPGIRFVVSTIPGACADELTQREWTRLEVRPIDDENIRRAIVLHYLGEFRKGITADQVRRVTADAKASSPLFLRVVAEELRLHGEHETLDAAIDRYAGSADLMDVFDRVLERLERDYGTATVKDVTSVIWASRAGLSEEELMALAGLNRLDLSRLLFALDYHLVQRGGVLGFFHDYLRRAVEKRYLAEPQSRRDRSVQLAACFERADVTIRTTLELFHALTSLGDHERLESAAAEIPRFALIWPAAEKDELLRMWASRDASTVVAAYRSSLEEWVRRENPGPVGRAAVLGNLYMLFMVVGAWAEAELVAGERLSLSREVGDRPGEVGALTQLAGLAVRLGRYEETDRVAQEAMAIARELGDLRGIAAGLNKRGLVHALRGEYDAALAFFTEEESISRTLGDVHNLAAAVGNRGTVYSDREEYDSALACFAEEESLARAAGDRTHTGKAISHRGQVHLRRREFEAALACWNEEEIIAREMGDRQMICAVAGNRGTVYNELGEYETALACFAEQESIARANGDRMGIALAVGNRGVAQSKRGNLQEAFSCYEAALDELREIGFRHAMSHWLERLADTLLIVTELDAAPSWLARFVPELDGTEWKRGCFQTARTHAEECLAISRELRKTDTLHSSQVLLARLDAAEARRDLAIERLRTMLAEAGDDDARADLHYWLWKLGAVEHAAAALAQYEALHANAPRQEYKKRIDELAG